MDKALWQQLQPLVDEALSMTAEARAPWLARIRNESPSLALELDRLLAEEGTLDRRGFLETPATGDRLVDRLLAGEMTVAQRSRLEGSLATRYTLGDELGRGGMATVYRASDIRHKRDVAIKVIRADASSALGAERFLAEIRLTANLTHPNILPLLDSGEAGGVLFYVMPFVDGESLRARLRRDGALPIDEATRILRVVAEALAHAHRKGLVHRDIKPDNVLLSGRETWVADFGIAKAMAQTATAAHAATSVGVALGSPGYMAPEQIEAANDVDHRADLYSWGVMAWEMLVGRPPFTGTSLQQLFTQHLTATPEPVGALRPDVPAPLADAVMRCLAKEPASRFASADELLAQLDALHLSGAHPPAKARRARPVTVGVGLALATAVGWGVLASREEAPWSAPRTLQIPADVGAIALSPTGAHVAYTRETAPGVWIQHVDSVEGRQLTKEPTPMVAFVDDSTIVRLARRQSGFAPTSFIHAANGGTTPIPFAVDTAGNWDWGEPGAITYTAVAADRRSITVRRLLHGAMGKAVTMPLDSGERVIGVSGSARTEGFLVTTVLADSTFQLNRLTEAGTRSVAATVGPRDPLRPRIQWRARQTVDGRFADLWLARDSVLRFDLRKPDRGYTVHARSVPGPLPGRALSGHMLVRSVPRSTETWRFPVPDDPESRAVLVDRTRGDVTEGALSPDEKIIARVSHPLGPATALQVQGLDGGPIRWLFRSPGNLTGIRWSPDGSRLAVREAVRRERPRWVVIDVRDGSVLRLGGIRSTWPLGAAPSSYPAVWSPDGSALFATSLDTLVPEVRRFALAEGDTGTVIFRGSFAPTLLDGLAMRPDGKALVVGGEALILLPLDGGPPRTIVPRDTMNHLVPFLYRADGTLAWSRPDDRMRSAGMNTGLRDIFVGSDRGGPVRRAGSFPIGCRLHIGLLRGEREATCFQMEQEEEYVLIHTGHH